MLFINTFTKLTKLHNLLHLGEDYCQALLDNNRADVNARMADGRTPLHIASIQDRSKIAQVLFRNGADINAKDNWGNTALHLAVLYGE